MTPERLLRQYFHAKDENRPHLLAEVFTDDARLDVTNRSEKIRFPAVTVGREAIADLLVRQFNATYENIYSFYLQRPGPAAENFPCDWIVAMTEKSSGNARVGCGSYRWTFRPPPDLRVARLAITIEQMIVLEPGRAADVMRALQEMDYPWTSAAQATKALDLKELASVARYIGASPER